MNVKVQNETTYPTREVGKLVRWVVRYLEVGDTRTLIKVKHHARRHAYAGRFYRDPHASGADIYDWDAGDYKEIAPRVPPTIDHLIVCRIGKPGVYPVQNHVYDRKDSPGTWLIETWQEALICIAAHEVFHLRQHKLKQRYSEVDTEWAAFRLLREWKAEQ